MRQLRIVAVLVLATLAAKAQYIPAGGSGGGGGGMSIAGTARKITVSGVCNDGTGTCTITLPTDLLLPVNVGFTASSSFFPSFNIPWGTCPVVPTSGDFCNVSGTLKHHDGTAMRNILTDNTAAGGDVSGTFPNIILNTVNANVGACGDSTHISQPTFNAKGLVTGCTAVAIGNAPTATALANLPTLCSAGNYPLGVLANGNATGCTAAGSGIANPYTNPHSGAAYYAAPEPCYTVVSSYTDYSGASATSLQVRLFTAPAYWSPRSFRVEETSTLTVSGSLGGAAVTALGATIGTTGSPSGYMTAFALMGASSPTFRESGGGTTLATTASGTQDVYLQLTNTSVNPAGFLSNLTGGSITTRICGVVLQ